MQTEPSKRSLSFQARGGGGGSRSRDGATNQTEPSLSQPIAEAPGLFLWGLGGTLAEKQPADRISGARHGRARGGELDLGRNLHGRARGLDHPARARRGGGDWWWGAAEPAVGRTGASNSIGESEGLLAVSFFFLSTFFFPSFFPFPGRDEGGRGEGD